MSKSSKKYMPTYIIIALNIIFYVCTSIIGGDFITTGDRAILLFGQVNYFVIYYGWYWQLFTSIFVHVSIVHLLGNMFFLLIFGLRAEELFSLKEYLLIYFLSGLTGNLLTLLFGFDMVSAGASGAIFGMFGACTIYFRRALGQSIISALLYAFFLLMISSGPSVNIFAHLGGLVVGLLIGYALAATRRFRMTYKYNYSFSAGS
ncbi:MAG: rhomboid family intramembrane serine protease [Candidatus Bathyarchaeia archaeon]